MIYCVRTQIDHDQSAQYSTASVATGCSHSTPALLSVSRNYIGFELNGRIRSLRSRFCTECHSDPRHLNAEFSHTLYRKVVLTSWDRGMSAAQLDPPTTARWY